MRKTLAVTVVLLVISAFVSVAMAETTLVFNPQSLVGEWWGEWRTINGQYSGRIYITVEKVDGNKIFGIAEASGADKYLRYEKFVAALEGNVLSITLSKLQLSLVIESETMKGNARGGQEINLELSKRK